MVWSEEEKLSYDVVFRGLDGDKKLLSLLKSVSKAVKRRDQPPSSLFLLRRWAKDDREDFVQALKSRGWFDAKVDATVSGDDEHRIITYAVSVRDLYHLGPMQLQLPQEPSRFVAPSTEMLGLKEGAPAESAPVFKAAEQLVAQARQQGFPRARINDQRFVLDREYRLLHVSFDFNPGPFVRLGQVRFSGADGIDESFLAKHLSWRPGAVYHPRRLDRIHRSLMGTNLFVTVTIELLEPPALGELWPVVIRLNQRKHRTVAAGGGFSTDKGVTLKGAWEHRNFLHYGQRIKSRTELGTEAQTVFLSHETPDFIQSEQKLTLSLNLDRKLENAYSSQAVQVGAGISRPVFSPGGEASMGLDWRIADVLEKSENQRSSFATVAIPLILKLDRSDDILDPGRGWRWHSEVEPVLALSSAGQPHMGLRNRGSVYHTLKSSPRIVVAGRAQIDSVVGASRGDLAADQRLYAGGSATLRGVGLQLAGPLDQQNKPVGGRSLLAFGTEVRFLVRENIGLVGFLDGARAYEGETPDLSEGMLLGAGVGGRYQTPIGPLRLDVGVPLRRRSGVDKPFQLYVSIGQAF